MKTSFYIWICFAVLLFNCSGEEPGSGGDYDINLTGLTVSDGVLTPAFQPDVKNYSITVGSSVDSILLDATCSDYSVSYSPTMPAALVTGSNLLTIQTVSPDGEKTNTVRIVVYRLSSAAELNSLGISTGYLSPSFNPAVTRYYVYLPSTTASVTVTATPSYTKAAVSITPSQPATLVTGSNRILIRVTAEDGSSTNDYVVDLYKAGAAYTSPSIGTLVYVPGGRFQRDSDSTNITAVSPFRISAREITREQFTNVTGLSDPSSTGYSSGQTDPVQSVNWYSALVFCNRLSLLEGLEPVYTINGSTNPDDWGNIPDDNRVDWNAAVADWDASGYRLPTEMEWMWAAMGANTDDDPWAVNTTGYSKNYSGESISKMISLTIGDYCWYISNSSTKTHPAGSKIPNELGIYDMSGNVWEWCWDKMASYPSGTIADYRGADAGTPRTVRGGDWSASEELCTVSYRNNINPHFRSESVGFRVVRP